MLLFNTDCAPELALDARRRGVPVRRHDVIYKLVDDVRDEISARTPLAREEEVLGGCAGGAGPGRGRGRAAARR